MHGSVVEPLVGAFVDSLCGFSLNLHVEFDGNDGFSLRKEARNLGRRVEDAKTLMKHIMRLVLSRKFAGPDEHRLH